MTKERAGWATLAFRSLDQIPASVRVSALGRFLLRIDPAPGACWHWRGKLDRAGYAVFRIGGRQIAGHRFSYAVVFGPIPDRFVVHHRCEVRDCVNPAHLETVSRQENTARGLARLIEIGRRRRGGGKKNWGFHL
jgi:hypothetical protein